MPDPDQRARRWAAACAVLLVAVAVWEIVAIRRARAAPDDDWRAAAAYVRARYQPGDLITFAPDWVDPIGRLHLGDLIPIEYAARMDAARFARIWVVSTRGARSAEVRGEPVDRTVVGGVTVERYEPVPAVVLADVRSELRRAKIEGASRAPTLELAEVGFTPRRCIQIVPTAGTPARITFPSLPAGTLVGYAGLADVFTRREIRRPGRLVVLGEDRALTEVVAGVDDGWVRFETPFPGGDLTFIASADAPQRQLCFAAEVRR